ncbi:MAG TPA: DUF4010 domain-containing protein [Candidatus Tumulicola sp.]|nr:DUF4010 domain-containing protein [Candidatus Tumulicola sp.]
MTPPPEVGAERFALLLGLSLFFGFAYEDFYSGELPKRPGGVRTFPLLALAGGMLYAIEPHYVIGFTAGLLILGAWSYAYVRSQLAASETAERGFIVPICNVLAYMLGAIALTQPLWICVAVAVVGVLLLGWKHTLHDWARRVPAEEIATAGKFLVLVGIVLPLLAGRPAIPYTSITLFGVWLAVIAVSGISYASYLLQRYVFPRGGVLLTSVLGGLYSSTATTVVLARRSRDEGMSPEFEAGIVAATGMMYLRIVVICTIFSLQLGKMLLLPLLVPCALMSVFAWLRKRYGTFTQARGRAPNPLQLSTAIVFAVLMVAIALVTTLVQAHLGRAGVYGLAAVVGVTDIDPFVLSLAQGGIANLGVATAALAIVIAASSNNVLKAAYAIAFSRRRESAVPVAALLGAAVVGLALGFAVLR